MKKGHIAEIRYLLDHRRWPEAWRDWEEGYSVWKSFGDMMNAGVAFFSKSANDDSALERYLTVLNAAPETSRSLNAVKADMYKKIIAETVPASGLFAGRDERRVFSEKLLIQAIELDPFNYTLDWKLFELYASANDEAKALAVIPGLLGKVPAPFKTGGTFKEIGDFYQSRIGNP